MARHLRRWRPDISTRGTSNHHIIFRHSNLPDTKRTQTPTTMTKIITITLAAATLFAVSSCTTRNKAPSGQSQSMPGMSAAEHAKM